MQKAFDPSEPRDKYGKWTAGFTSMPADGLEPEKKPDEKPKKYKVGGWKHPGAWKQIGPALGTNAGGKYADPAGGNHYVKFYENEEQSKSEKLANSIYSEAGALVNPSETVMLDGKKGVSAPWLEDGIAFNPPPSDDPTKYSAATEYLKQHFAVDAFLGNRDIMGQGFDNIKLKNGVPWRLDNGGSMFFRAQGGDKHFGPNVEELDSMRDPKLAPQAAQVFGSLSDAEIGTQVQALAKALPDEKIDELVAAAGFKGEVAKKYSSTLKARRDDLVKRFPAPIAPAPVDDAGINHGPDLDAEIKEINATMQGATTFDSDKVFALTPGYGVYDSQDVDERLAAFQADDSPDAQMNHLGNLANGRYEDKDSGSKAGQFLADKTGDHVVLYKAGDKFRVGRMDDLDPDEIDPDFDIFAPQRADAATDVDIATQNLITTVSESPDSSGSIVDATQQLLKMPESMQAQVLAKLQVSKFPPPVADSVATLLQNFTGHKWETKALGDAVDVGMGVQVTPMGVVPVYPSATQDEPKSDAWTEDQVWDADMAQTTITPEYAAKLKSLIGGVKTSHEALIDAANGYYTDPKLAQEMAAIIASKVGPDVVVVEQFEAPGSYRIRTADFAAKNAEQPLDGKKWMGQNNFAGKQPATAGLAPEKIWTATAPAKTIDTEQKYLVLKHSILDGDQSAIEAAANAHYSEFGLAQGMAMMVAGKSTANVVTVKDGDHYLLGTPQWAHDFEKEIVGDVWPGLGNKPPSPYAPKGGETSAPAQTTAQQIIASPEFAALPNKSQWGSPTFSDVKSLAEPKSGATVLDGKKGGTFKFPDGSSIHFDPKALQWTADEPEAEQPSTSNLVKPTPPAPVQRRFDLGNRAALEASAKLESGAPAAAIANARSEQLPDGVTPQMAIAPDPESQRGYLEQLKQSQQPESAKWLAARYDAANAEPQHPDANFEQLWAGSTALLPSPYHSPTRILADLHSGAFEYPKGLDEWMLHATDKTDRQRAIDAVRDKSNESKTANWLTEYYDARDAAQLPTVSRYMDDYAAGSWFPPHANPSFAAPVFKQPENTPYPIAAADYMDDSMKVTLPASSPPSGAPVNARIPQPDHIEKIDMRGLSVTPQMKTLADVASAATSKATAIAAPVFASYRTALAQGKGVDDPFGSKPAIGVHVDSAHTFRLAREVFPPALQVARASTPSREVLEALADQGGSRQILQKLAGRIAAPLLAELGVTTDEYRRLGSWIDEWQASTTKAGATNLRIMRNMLTGRKPSENVYRASKGQPFGLAGEQAAKAATKQITAGEFRALLVHKAIAQAMFERFCDPKTGTASLERGIGEDVVKSMAGKLIDGSDLLEKSGKSVQARELALSGWTLRARGASDWSGSDGAVLIRQTRPEEVWHGQPFSSLNTSYADEAEFFVANDAGGGSYTVTTSTKPAFGNYIVQPKAYRNAVHAGGVGGSFGPLEGLASGRGLQNGGVAVLQKNAASSYRLPQTMAEWYAPAPEGWTPDADAAAAFVAMFTQPDGTLVIFPDGLIA